MLNLCLSEQCKLYTPVFERNYIPTNLHSFHTLHINAAHKLAHGLLYDIKFGQTGHNDT
jgi:hypothetical protein